MGEKIKMLITIGFIGTFIIGFVVGIILNEIQPNKFTRDCLNCKYAIPSTSKAGNIELYCNRFKGEGIQSFPLRRYNCCGHFVYTDEIQEERTRISLEKSYKKS